MTDLSLPVVLNAVCVLVYLALAAHLLRSQAPRPTSRFLAGAVASVALWAAMAAWRDHAHAGNGAVLVPAAATAAAQALEGAVWVAALIALLRPERRHLPMVVAVVAAAVLAMALPPVLWAAGLWPSGGEVVILGGLGLALAGLVALENVCRRTASGTFWSIKFLCFGVGGIFAYDFFIYSKAALFWQVDVDLLQARSAIHLILVPALAVGASRLPEMRGGLALSHRLALHTAALLGAGCYMILMGLAGLYMREFGGHWGPLLQVVFLSGSAVLLAVLLGSGRIRAHVRVLIAKHFFAYKYDYREEWLRFIAAVSAGEAGEGVRPRLIAAVAGIVDSPGGALWQRDDAGAFQLVATWNQPRIGLAERVGGGIADYLESRGWIVQLSEPLSRHPGLQVPEWLAASGLWLLVPLMHRDGLLGFLALQPARAPRRLDWEDHDLLKTVGRQAASHLSEFEAMRALADARQLELFNRRFAFVIHDLKTIIAQMSLLLANADRHGANPAFQRDLVPSVRESVEAMTALLAQINAERRKEPPVDLTALARGAVARLPDVPPAVLDARGLVEVAGDPQRLQAILAHLLDNAREAAGPHGHVVLRLRTESSLAVLEVEDDGAGMDGAFIRDTLFRPFASTKAGGFGIGAYQCRELVRELGGQLVVDSAPGRGTTMRVLLPLGEASNAAAPIVTQRKVVQP